jgi:hypothetical protein
MNVEKLIRGKFDAAKSRLQQSATKTPDWVVALIQKTDERIALHDTRQAEHDALVPEYKALLEESLVLTDHVIAEIGRISDESYARMSASGEHFASGTALHRFFFDVYVLFHKLPHYRAKRQLIRELEQYR